VHIPDGYLGPATYTTLWGAMIPAWTWASRRARKTLQAKQVPLLAIGAAFTFLLMMFNVPTPGGTTGHAVGSTLVAIVLGPASAVIAVSIALVVQALLFGDGGVTALGANCFNMAFVMPVVGYGFYRLLSGGANASLRRKTLAAGAAGYLSLGAASFCTALELGLQPHLAHAANGAPLYCPYSWRVTIPVMLGQHLLFFGWIEGIVTGFVVRYLWRHDAKLMERT
jgi:cobalt/nickel transport system permease protein